MSRAADDWKACPPGELGRLSSRLRSRRIRRNAVKSGIALAAIALLALGVWKSRPDPAPQEMGNFKFAGIHCSRVIELARDYAMGKLDPQLSDQIKSHIEQCPKCHERFKAMGMISAMRPRDESLRRSAPPEASSLSLSLSISRWRSEGQIASLWGRSGRRPFSGGHVNRLAEWGTLVD